jgi:hypothetical protein
LRLAHAARQRRLLVDDPALGGAMADDDLVQQDVDAGELEVRRREVVEDHVRICLPAGDRLLHEHVGEDLVVDRQRLVDVEDGGRVLTE